MFHYMDSKSFQALLLSPITSKSTNTSYCLQLTVIGQGLHFSVTRLQHTDESEIVTIETLY